MNQNSGVYIFRDKNDTPVLIAYKKLSNMSYLTLMHYDSTIISYYTKYYNLLDTIPINSKYLHIYLPILNNHKLTIDRWYRLICEKMIEMV
jgi:hypothetical protein